MRWPALLLALLLAFVGTSTRHTEADQPGSGLNAPVSAVHVQTTASGRLLGTPRRHDGPASTARTGPGRPDECGQRGRNDDRSLVEPGTAARGGSRLHVPLT